MLTIPYISPQYRPMLMPILLAFLVALLVVQTVRIEGFKFWPLKITGLSEKLNSAKTKIRDMSTAKNEQKIITRDRIVEVERKALDADKVAERIEKAPLPGLCKTPGEILGADL